ncbi:protein O-GlcNAcase [Brevibacillus sp. H7]|uniref:protein O-GlcNAcase n=1 Tax=Brevibacillus sp. H7 TaxID=3349138 RepID=UPI0037FD2312
MKPYEYFSIRGVIEGFYGTPWAHAERIDMIAFLKRHGFNAYFYSPKDDPYLRERWQEPHPERALTDIADLIRESREQGVDFIYCLSPGLNMEYSSTSHFDRMMDKYRQMYEQGVRKFGLLFDDIPQQLLHAEDRVRFAHLAEAHAATTLKAWEVLQGWGEEVSLIICPTVYNGLGNEPYITYLGRQLPPEIHLFWTGRFVCSPFLTEGDAVRFYEYTGHRPLYWDNYPVNDLAMANELHIGPLLHRDRHLYQHAAGYVANAMEYVESSKIPLITIADYLRDPEGYDPVASWQKAVEEVAGTADSPHFLRFADNVQSSFLNEQESPQLLEAFQEFRFHFLHGNQRKAVSQLKSLFTEMEQTAGYLMTRMKNRKLAAEIRGWLEKYLLWAKVGQSAASLIEEGVRGRTAQAVFHLIRLKQLLKRTERLPQKVCGNVMKLFVDAVLQEVQKAR